MLKRNLLFLFLVTVLIFGLYFAQKRNNPPKNAQTISQVHQVKFYDDHSFLEGIEKSKGVVQPNYLIRGGIVPHHLYPGFIIADFFKRLSFQNPKTIILIGPNHYEKGDFKALTSLYGWETPYGLANPDLDLISSLKVRNLVEVDEEVLPNDHAVSGSIPFIKYYIPETKIVPILLKRGFSEKESEILASNLAELVNNDTVVVAAVDFSHYLTSEQAKEKDKVTEEIMKDFDYKRLYLLSSDFLDSPPSIGVMLMVMQKLNATKSEILFHTNSGLMQKNNSVETTSYFSTVFYDPGDSKR